MGRAVIIFWFGVVLGMLLVDADDAFFLNVSSALGVFVEASGKDASCFCGHIRKAGTFS